MATFFEQYPIPAFEHLSPASMQALEAYQAQGNSQFKSRQLLEFFKSLDWMPVDAIKPNPIEKLAETDARRIYREIEAYLAQKATQRQKNTERRKAHQLSVFEYFRTHVSPQDKALLESLRDYELNRTGRDANWQHYFSFKSYKKIDEFRLSTLRERQQRIEAFQADVETYQKNVEKLRHQAHCMGDDGLPFNFDDWCDWAIDEETFQTRQTTGQGHKTSGNGRRTSLSPLERAFQCLCLKPNASMPEVKKQFRQMTLAHHPDMPGGNAERMKELIAAYEAIKRASGIADRM